MKSRVKKGNGVGALAGDEGVGVNCLALHE